MHSYINDSIILITQFLLLLQNARVHHLIKVLMRAELYQAANYLNNDLLQLGRVLQPEPEDTPAHISTGATHPVSGPHCSDEQKQRSAPPEKDRHAEQNPLMSPVSLSEERTMSDNLSHYSSASISVLDQGGIWLSQLERQSSVSHEDKEEAWIGTTFFLGGGCWRWGCCCGFVTDSCIPFGEKIACV